MTVGAYRQVIMVFPDLDVVTVTTARVDNYALSEWDDAIVRSVKSDKALPADATDIHVRVTCGAWELEDSRFAISASAKEITSTNSVVVGVRNNVPTAAISGP